VAGADEEGKLHRLPSGRHGLPPEYVERNHRERLAAGVIAAVAEHGFREAGVTQIAAAAGVSRRTFYGYFEDKEECYFDTYRLIEDNLVQIASEAGEPEASWTAKVRARAAALVDVLAANPDLVRFTLIAPPSVGGEILERKREFLRRLLDCLTDGAPSSRGYTRPSEEELEALAGAVSAVLTSRVSDDDAAQIVEDVPQLVEMVLVPILGRARAATEAEKAGRN
jgi:AcrR family transcriptional regulator